MDAVIYSRQVSNLLDLDRPHTRTVASYQFGALISYPETYATFDRFANILSRMDLSTACT